MWTCQYVGVLLFVSCVYGEFKLNFKLGNKLNLLSIFLFPMIIFNCCGSVSPPLIVWIHFHYPAYVVSVSVSAYVSLALSFWHASSFYYLLNKSLTLCFFEWGALNLKDLLIGVLLLLLLLSLSLSQLLLINAVCLDMSFNMAYLWSLSDAFCALNTKGFLGKTKEIKISLSDDLQVARNE